MRRSLLFSLACSLFALSMDSSARVVQTEQGQLAASPSRVEGVLAWRGIPYAAPPIGERRWRPPAPPEAWEGVRSGEAFGPRCMQTNPFPDMIWNSPEESEDCLYLSIWAPAQAEGLPVLFWIHGGGFLSGSGDEARHDGSALAALDAVVVTINYRLGIFGFLAHEELGEESDLGASGNYAFMDMIAALRWVRQNIDAFGGNPGNVTIFGESAGSYAVSGLMASPQSEGLFHKAIGQSGAFMEGSDQGFDTLQAAEARGGNFLRAMGVSSISALRQQPAAALIKASDAWQGSATGHVDGLVFDRTPWQVFAEGRQHDVPLIAGWTSAETKWVEADLVELAALRARQFPEQLARAEQLYPAQTDAEAWHAAIQLNSDLWMAYPTWRWLDTHARTGSSPVYRYVFDQVQASTDGPVPDNDPGAAHATDIPFVFQRMDFLGQPVSTEDRQVAALMGHYWVNFARTGDPNGADLPPWPAVHDAPRHPVMWLNSQAAVRTESDPERARLVLVGTSRGD